MTKLFAALENEETLLDEDISDITPTESEIISDDVIELATDTAAEAELAMEQIENAFAYCERLSVVAERMSLNKSVSTEDIKEIRGYAESIVARHGVSLECIYPAISLEQNYELALEEVSNKQTAIIEAAGNVLKNVATRVFDTITYSFKVITYNNNKQKQIASEISKLGNAKADLIIYNPSSNFCYGDNELVASFSEYAKEYKRMTEVMSKFNSLTSDFISKDFLSTLKLIFRSLTMSGDKSINQLYITIDGFAKELSSIDDFKVNSEINNSRDTVALINKPMLGNKQIAIVKAERPTSNFVALTVGVSFSSPSTTGAYKKGETLTLGNVTGKDITNVLDMSQNMTASIAKHKNIRGILSQLGQLSVINSYVKTPGAIVTRGLFVVISRSWKAFISTQISLMNSVAVGTAYSIRQQKQATALAERFKQSVK